MSDIENFNDDVRACDMCGGPVKIQNSLAGTSYYIAVNEEWLQKMMDEFMADEFIRDRLRRAERIIKELRAEIEERKK